MNGGLDEIAKRLGIAVSTVSRALAGKSGVSAARREEILALAKALGTSVNRQASALRARQGRGLAVITRIVAGDIVNLRDQYLFQFGKERFGHVAVLTVDDGEGVNSAVHKAVEEGCRAVVLSGGGGPLTEETRDLTRKRKIPVASIDCRREGADNALIDRADGVRQATRLLLLSGRERPVFFSSCGINAPDDRLRGTIAAYESLGRRAEDIQLVNVSGRMDSFQTGAEATENLLRTRSVDGMFCYNDRMAIGALRALAKAGVDVPRDVAVIGFDNLPITEYLPISLTTVAQPARELAERAIAFCQERLDAIDAPFREEVLPTRLIVRESAPIADHALRRRIFDE